MHVQALQEMDSAHFLKLCRECDLLGHKLTATDADLIFCKVWPTASDQDCCNTVLTLETPSTSHAN